ncbi:MAG: PepSY-associated TM helix domain-containing protein [Pseudomonadota bacterium]
MQAVDSNTARRRSILWRIHFWAALVASPFTLVAVLTGMLYIFTPQIEAAQLGWLDQVEPAGAMRPLDDAVAAASDAAPAGLRLQSVMPAYGARDSVKAVFVEQAGESGEHHDGAAARVPAQPLTVYVNPYTADVIGQVANADRFGSWARHLHSRLLQGDGWRWMIELAASAMMVMLLSGIALWWPSATQQGLPQADARGASAWKQWHAFVDVVLGALTLTILATGLTWSKYAGEQIRAARDATGQAPPRVPANLESAHHEVGLTWQAAWDVTRRLGPDVAVQLSEPRSRHEVWRASSADPSQPTKKFDLVLDAADGTQLYYAGWEKQTVLSKATAIGMPFHRGEFGWWNQALLLLFCIGLLFTLISGWVMYFERRQPGTFGLPRLAQGTSKEALAPAAAILVLCVLMPVLAVATLAILFIELLLRLIRHRKTVIRA